MFITSIEVQNWRNFRAGNVKLQRRTFIIGPNASGKSNFIDAIRFLRDISLREGGGLQQAVQNRGGISKIRCLSARTNPNVFISVTLADTPGSSIRWRYELSIGQEPRGQRRPIVKTERVWQNEKIRLDRPNEQDLKDNELLTQTHLEQISANAQFRELVEMFQSIEYLHLVPQIVRLPQYFGGKVVPLDPYGQTFLARLAKTKQKTRESRLSRIEKALQRVVPQLQKLSLVFDEIGTPHLEARYVHWRESGARQREDQFSDGTLRIIALFWTLLEGDSLLLLEEPELSLNSDIVKRMPSLIWSIQRQTNRQVIITTHSQELLSDRGVSPSEVLALLPGVNGTEIVSSEDLAGVTELYESGMSIGEAAIPRIRPTDLHQLRLDF